LSGTETDVSEAAKLVTLIVIPFLFVKQKSRMDVPFALICATSLTEGVNDWGCLHAANKDRTMSSVHILYFLIVYYLIIIFLHKVSTSECGIRPIAH
jgi:hypothetical protein